MAAEEHVRDWLTRFLTGCHFASALARRRDGVLFGRYVEPTSGVALDALFDVAATRHVPAVAVFPQIRTESELVAQLGLLLADERWSLSIEHPTGLDTDDVLVGLRWRTSGGLSSAVMGLAPLMTMPLTRRAPHVCLAAWTGGHENPRVKRRPPDSVDFLDASLDDLDLDATKYKRRWNESVADTTELLSDPPDAASNYRSVAFRLGAEVRGRVEQLVSSRRAT